MTDPQEQPSANIHVPVTAAELQLLEDIAYENDTTPEQLARAQLVAYLVQEQTRRDEAAASSGCAVWLAAPLIGVSLLVSEVTGLTDVI